MRVEECKERWEDRNGMVIKMKQSQKVTGPRDYFSFVSFALWTVGSGLTTSFYWFMLVIWAQFRHWKYSTIQKFLVSRTKSIFERN